MTQLYLCLSVPEEHLSPSDRELLPSLMMRGQLSAPAKLGRNTLLFAPQGFRASALLCQDGPGTWQSRLGVALPFDFTFFNGAQRRQRDASYAQLSQLVGRPCEKIDTLYPFIALAPEAGEVAIYHYLAIGRRGALFVAYDRQPCGEQELSADDIVDLIKKSRDVWQVVRPSFNQACWYSKWRRDMEMERKYTFPQPVDIWVLIQKLYRQTCDGQLAGFIPEFNDEFQIWDYDNYMFEVLEPPAEAGYISFIPQSDGLMTVKRKRFLEDSEIRQETLSPHVDLKLDQIEAYAREQSKGRIRALPPFRRKRFDINLESLDTGNVYGIFLDICRPFGDDQHALCQCEVEYLRSRTMGPIHHIVEEYEQVCDFTKTFLLAQNTSFTEGFYSKLSFMRDYADKVLQSKEK